MPAVISLRMAILTALAAVAVQGTRAQTAALLDEYSLRGTLADNLGGPALTPVLFSGVAGAITPTGYVFGANQGLLFVNPAFSPDTYSIELSFNFSLTSGYRKILDFKGLAVDAGFYNLNTALNFYPVATGVTGDFANGVTEHVVLTRDGVTGAVIGYVNGVQRFSFTDSSNLAVFSTSDHRAVFVVDDIATSQNESSGGTLNFIRIYNGVLTPSQVHDAYLLGAPLLVPEPATSALLALGAAMVLAATRRRSSAVRMKR